MRILIVTILSLAVLAGCQTTKFKKSEPKNKSKVEQVKKKTVKKAKRKQATPKGVKGLVIKWAKHYGVPVKIALSVAHIESGFRCHVIGQAGEVGPLQIKPDSARILGYRGSNKTLRGSCSEQVKWGMLHLKKAYNRSKGSKNRVWLTAYGHNRGWGWKNTKNKHARAYAGRVVSRYRRI